MSLLLSTRYSVHCRCCTTCRYVSFVLTMLCLMTFLFLCFFFQAEDGIRDLVRSRGLGDVYKRQQWGCRRVRSTRGPALRCDSTCPVDLGSDWSGA